MSWDDNDRPDGFDNEPDQRSDEPDQRSDLPDRLRDEPDRRSDEPDRRSDEPDRRSDELNDDPADHRWPLTWRGLYPRERWLWFEQLWTDACMLRDRYRLTIRSGWWEDQIQVETLAALAAWAARYDAGEWDDPPGKLALLFDLERAAALLKDGNEPFHPERDRPAFERHLAALGCRSIRG